MKQRRRLHRKIDDKELRRLWSSRMTERTIGMLLGHSPSTLRRRAVKLGLPSSRRKLWATH